MKTIEIIDLLNKISNGEEAPLKIKYIGYIFEYENPHYFGNDIGYLFERYNVIAILNDEVEIIEENKIPEKLGKIEDNDGYIDQYDVIKIGRKVDEIIDYLESKEEEK